MKLSSVTTLYNSEKHIEEFYSRVSKVAHQLVKNDFEIIFVDDGSKDNSLSVAKNLINKSVKVKLIQLSRNFGHHYAIIAGLDIAEGDYVFLIDSDLEEQPELLEKFYEKINLKDDYDVIFGVQNSRKGNLFEELSGNIFYTLFNFFSDKAFLVRNLSTIRIMKKNYVKELLNFKDKEFFLAPIADLAGFSQSEIRFDKLSISKTTYNLLSKYNLFLQSIFSFSLKPLYFIFYSGILITLSSFTYIFYLLYRYFLFDINVSGWTSLVLSVWFLGGVIISFLGILSIYISKIYIETKGHPRYIIKKIFK